MPWRARRRRGRHESAHLPSSPAPMWAPALLGLVVFVALVLLLLTYV
ncbi:hypothetical protein [Saccharothrix sp. NRRL B-16314]|nr:hypothetical protein [Saccharothrix sp. NRRL B-16314]